jgi:hypothetical protein
VLHSEQDGCLTCILRVVFGTVGGIHSHIAMQIPFVFSNKVIVSQLYSHLFPLYLFSARYPPSVVFLYNIVYLLKKSMIIGVAS